MENEDPAEICESCRFWEAFQTGSLGTYGFCRRRAPNTVATSKGGEFEARWPLTHERDWCGEWRVPRDPAPDRTPRNEILFVAT